MYCNCIIVQIYIHKKKNSHVGLWRRSLLRVWPHSACWSAGPPAEESRRCEPPGSGLCPWFSLPPPRSHNKTWGRPGCLWRGSSQWPGQEVERQRKSETGGRARIQTRTPSLWLRYLAQAHVSHLKLVLVDGSAQAAVEKLHPPTQSALATHQREIKATLVEWNLLQDATRTNWGAAGHIYSAESRAVFLPGQAGDGVEVGNLFGLGLVPHAPPGSPVEHPQPTSEDSGIKAISPASHGFTCCCWVATDRSKLPNTTDWPLGLVAATVNSFSVRSWL